MERMLTDDVSQLWPTNFLSCKSSTCVRTDSLWHLVIHVGSRPITIQRESGEIYSVGVVPAGQNPFEKITGMYVNYRLVLLPLIHNPAEFSVATRTCICICTHKHIFFIQCYSMPRSFQKCLLHFTCIHCIQCHMGIINLYA